MWMITTFGFFSAVQKPGDSDLTIRSRAREDLEQLRERYLPGLGAVQAHVGSDYAYRAKASHEDFARALAAAASDIDYPNFKNAAKAQAGSPRASVYGEVWHALLGIESGPDAKTKNRKPTTEPT